MKLNQIQTQVNNTRTKLRGDNDQEYQIYVQAAKDLGWRIKSYQE